MVIETRAPECKPTPVHPIDVFNVF